jgi:hypothetical protein
MESRLPPDEQMAERLMRDYLRLAAAGLPLRAFYELPFDERWDERLPGAIRTITRHNMELKRAEGATALLTGFKLRCGGTEAHAFPTPEQVARAIILCRDARLAMKCTAGLHHPFRHFREEVNTEMHGFVNVFGAGILTHVHQMAADEVTELLSDEKPSSFRFTDEHFSWRDLRATTGQIRELRENALISFGSCSFDEPREDLRAEGLL